MTSSNTNNCYVCLVPVDRSDKCVIRNKMWDPSYICSGCWKVLGLKHDCENVDSVFEDFDEFIETVIRPLLTQPGLPRKIYDRNKRIIDIRTIERELNARKQAFQLGEE